MMKETEPRRALSFTDSLVNMQHHFTVTHSKANRFNCEKWLFLTVNALRRNCHTFWLLKSSPTDNKPSIPMPHRFIPWIWRSIEASRMHGWVINVGDGHRMRSSIGAILGFKFGHTPIHQWYQWPTKCKPTWSKVVLKMSEKSLFFSLGTSASMKEFRITQHFHSSRRTRWDIAKNVFFLKTWKCL